MVLSICNSVLNLFKCNNYKNRQNESTLENISPKSSNNEIALSENCITVSSTTVQQKNEIKKEIPIEFQNFQEATSKIGPKISSEILQQEPNRQDELFIQKTPENNSDASNNQQEHVLSHQIQIQDEIRVEGRGLHQQNQRRNPRGAGNSQKRREYDWYMVGSSNNQGGSNNNRGRSSNNRGRSSNNRGRNSNNRGRSSNHRGKSSNNRGGNISSSSRGGRNARTGKMNYSEGKHETYSRPRGHNNTQRPNRGQGGRNRRAFIHGGINKPNNLRSSGIFSYKNACSKFNYDYNNKNLTTSNEKQPIIFNHYTIKNYIMKDGTNSEIVKVETSKHFI